MSLAGCAYCLGLVFRGWKLGEKGVLGGGSSALLVRREVNGQYVGSRSLPLPLLELLESHRSSFHSVGRSARAELASAAKSEAEGCWLSPIRGLVGVSTSSVAVPAVAVTTSTTTRPLGRALVRPVALLATVKTVALGPELLYGFDNGINLGGLW